MEASLEVRQQKKLAKAHISCYQQQEELGRTGSRDAAARSKKFSKSDQKKKVRIVSSSQSNSCRENRIQSILLRKELKKK
jgi:hypothetical protein